MTIDNLDSSKRSDSLGSTKRKISRMIPIKLVVLLLIVIVVLGGLFYYLQDQSNNGKTTLVDSGNDLETYKFSTKSNGQGMTFEKMSELKPESVSSDNSDILFSKETNATTNKEHNVSTIQVASVDKNSVSKDGLTASITNIALAATKSANKGGSKTLSLTIPNGTKTIYTFNETKDFTNKNIKTDAKQTDFTLTRTTSTGKVIDKRVGSVLNLSTQKANYYFLAWSTEDNWKSQQQKWGQIFNSLKVDQ